VTGARQLPRWGRQWKRKNKRQSLCRKRREVPVIVLQDYPSLLYRRNWSAKNQGGSFRYMLYSYLSKVLTKELETEEDPFASRKFEQRRWQTCILTSEYFRGVSDTILGEIARFGTITNYDAAAVVHQLNDPLTSICFILRGRLKTVRVDSRGDEHLFQIFERGEQYGMILGGLGESIPVRIFALEPSRF
jgi:hypothetical protein